MLPMWLLLVLPFYGLKFNKAVRKVSCRYCGYYQSVYSKRDGKCCSFYPYFMIPSCTAQLPFLLFPADLSWCPGFYETFLCMFLTALFSFVPVPSQILCPSDRKAGKQALPGDQGPPRRGRDTAISWCLFEPQKRVSQFCSVEFASCHLSVHRTEIANAQSEHRNGTHTRLLDQLRSWGE